MIKSMYGIELNNRDKSFCQSLYQELWYICIRRNSLNIHKSKMSVIDTR